MSQHHSRDYRQYRRNRATVLSQTTVCWLCGLPGSDEVDHVIPISRGGTHDLSNLRPVHGTRTRRCNQRRGARPIDITQTYDTPPAFDW